MTYGLQLLNCRSYFQNFILIIRNKHLNTEILKINKYEHNTLRRTTKFVNTITIDNT